MWSMLIYKTQSFVFDVHVTVHRDKFLIIKPTRCTNFSYLFWNETLHVLDSSSVHHQEFLTVNTAIHTGLRTACKQDQDGMAFRPDPAFKLSANLYDIHHCRVYCGKLLMMEEKLSETCRVSFQNKFQKLVHLVGFIIRNVSRCTVT